MRDQRCHEPPPIGDGEFACRGQQPITERSTKQAEQSTHVSSLFRKGTQREEIGRGQPCTEHISTQCQRTRLSAQFMNQDGEDVILQLGKFSSWQQRASARRFLHHVRSVPE